MIISDGYTDTFSFTIRAGSRIMVLKLYLRVDYIKKDNVQYHRGYLNKTCVQLCFTYGKG